VNASHVLHEKFADKKSDNEQLGCDDSLDFQSRSPADYHHKVIHTIRTTERGMLLSVYISERFYLIALLYHLWYLTRSPAVAEGPRDADVPVEMLKIAAEM